MDGSCFLEWVVEAAREAEAEEGREGVRDMASNFGYTINPYLPLLLPLIVSLCLTLWFLFMTQFCSRVADCFLCLPVCL